MASITEKNPNRFPLEELLSDQALKDPSAVFEKLFPGLTEDQLKSVRSFKVGVLLPRPRQSWAKYFSWSAPHNKADGLSKEQMLQFLKSIKKITQDMSPDWNQLVGVELTRDWNLATEMVNHEAWMKNKRGEVFDRPVFEKDSDFQLQLYPVLVNPDRPTQVWSVGGPLSFDEFGSAQDEAWEELNSAETIQKLEKSFNIHDLPRQLKPRIRWLWTLTAPDGEQSVKLPSVAGSNWETVPVARQWYNARLEKIEEAYDKAGRWAAQELVNEVSSKKEYRAQKANRHSKGESESVDVSVSGFRREIVKMSPEDWDLFDQRPPRDLADLDAMLNRLFEQNPNHEGAQKIKEAFKSSVMLPLFDSFGWASKSWVMAPEVREKICERPWLSASEIEEIVEAEQMHFAERCKGAQLLKYVKELSQEEKQSFSDLVYWNDCKFSPEISQLLNNTSPTTHVEVVEIELSEEESAKNIAKERLVRSSLDWKPLLEAFGMEALSMLSRDEEGNFAFETHPFASWMSRLSPPKEVVQSTEKWLEEAEVFNNINRSILQAKDKSESALNLELVEKLKNVIETSNRILEESRQSGGWWGRVRKNMSSNEVSSDQWAAVYLEFQDHMLKMFENINQQIERDKTWMRYADHIKSSSGEVNQAWQKWLSETAQRLDQERQNAETDQITSEKKIEWNNSVNTLESAQSAFEHIRTANSISDVLLEKVRQSVGVKERLQQRSMMFYWSSLNMFAGLQSIQRNTNTIGEQSEFVEEMAKSFHGTVSRSLKDEAEQKEKIREAFRNMAQSETGMKQFYETITAFQKDTVAILSDLSENRVAMQEETAQVAVMSSAAVKKKAKSKTITADEAVTPSPSAKRAGPR